MWGKNRSKIQLQTFDIELWLYFIYHLIMIRYFRVQQTFPKGLLLQKTCRKCPRNLQDWNYLVSQFHWLYLFQYITILQEVVRFGAILEFQNFDYCKNDFDWYLNDCWQIWNCFVDVAGRLNVYCCYYLLLVNKRVVKLVVPLQYDHLVHLLLISENKGLVNLKFFVRL